MLENFAELDKTVKGFPQVAAPAKALGRVSEKKGQVDAMALCPACEADLDLDEHDIDEGSVISCPDCGADFEIVTAHPLELNALDEDDEDDEDEDEELEDDDEDFDEDDEDFDDDEDDEDLDDEDDEDYDLDEDEDEDEE